MDYFPHIIGYSGIKNELTNIVNILNNPQRFIELGARLPKNLMLIGMPGVGKTTFAKDFIAATNHKCFLIRKDKADGEFVKYIKDVFQQAKEYNNSVVFLDDMDKFANDDIRHRNCQEYITIQSCIDDIGDANVFVIATANSTMRFPRSLTREGRFDHLIRVSAPNKEDCEKIVEYYLSRNKRLKDIDYKNVATLLVGKSCATLEACLNEAAILAAYGNKDYVENEDIIKACLKIIHGYVDDLKIDKEEKKIIAASEAGAIVISELQNHPIALSTIYSIHNRLATHRISGSKNLRKLLTKEGNELNEIQLCLGAKAAVEVFENTHSVICESDISHAFGMARILINDLAYYGFDCCCTEDSSNASKNRLSVKSAQLVKQQYEEVKRMLLEHKDFYQEIFNLLMEKEYITFYDILPIKEKYQIA